MQLRLPRNSGQVCKINKYHATKMLIYMLLENLYSTKEESISSTYDWGFSVYCDCKMNLASSPLGIFMQLVSDSNTKATSHNHHLSSLSTIRVTTLWLKQPTCFCKLCLNCKHSELYVSQTKGIQLRWPNLVYMHKKSYCNNSFGTHLKICSKYFLPKLSSFELHSDIFP